MECSPSPNLPGSRLHAYDEDGALEDLATLTSALTMHAQPHVKTRTSSALTPASAARPTKRGHSGECTTGQQSAWTDAEANKENTASPALQAAGITPSRLDRIKELREELTCGVCLEVCCRPSTTPCGHTFCRSCLRKALSHAAACPKCRSPVEQDGPLKINTALWNTIVLLFPKEVDTREPPTPETQQQPKSRQGRAYGTNIHRHAHSAQINPFRPPRLSLRPPSGSLQGPGVVADLTSLPPHSHAIADQQQQQQRGQQPPSSRAAAPNSTSGAAPGQLRAPPGALARSSSYPLQDLSQASQLQASSSQAVPSRLQALLDEIASTAADEQELASGLFGTQLSQHSNTNRPLGDAEQQAAPTQPSSRPPRAPSSGSLQGSSGPVASFNPFARVRAQPLHPGQPLVRVSSAPLPAAASSESSSGVTLNPSATAGYQQMHTADGPSHGPAGTLPRPNSIGGAGAVQGSRVRAAPEAFTTAQLLLHARDSSSSSRHDMLSSAFHAAEGSSRDQEQLLLDSFPGLPLEDMGNDVNNSSMEVSVAQAQRADGSGAGNSSAHNTLEHDVAPRAGSINAAQAGAVSGQGTLSARASRDLQTHSSVQSSHVPEDYQRLRSGRDTVSDQQDAGTFVPGDVELVGSSQHRTTHIAGDDTGRHGRDQTSLHGRQSLGSRVSSPTHAAQGRARSTWHGEDQWQAQPQQHGSGHRPVLARMSAPLGGQRSRLHRSSDGYAPSAAAAGVTPRYMSSDIELQHDEVQLSTAPPVASPAGSSEDGSARPVLLDPTAGGTGQATYAGSTAMDAADQHTLNLQMRLGLQVRTQRPAGAEGSGLQDEHLPSLQQAGHITPGAGTWDHAMAGVQDERGTPAGSDQWLQQAVQAEDDPLLDPSCEADWGYEEFVAGAHEEEIDLAALDLFTASPFFDAGMYEAAVQAGGQQPREGVVPAPDAAGIPVSEGATGQAQHLGAGHTGTVLAPGKVQQAAQQQPSMLQGREVHPAVGSATRPIELLSSDDDSGEPEARSGHASVRQAGPAQAGPQHAAGVVPQGQPTLLHQAARFVASMSGSAAAAGTSQGSTATTGRQAGSIAAPFRPPARVGVAAAQPAGRGTNEDVASAGASAADAASGSRGVPGLVRRYVSGLRPLRKRGGASSAGGSGAQPQ